MSYVEQKLFANTAFSATTKQGLLDITAKAIKENGEICFSDDVYTIIQYSREQIAETPLTLDDLAQFCYKVGRLTYHYCEDNNFTDNEVYKTIEIIKKLAKNNNVPFSKNVITNLLYLSFLNSNQHSPVGGHQSTHRFVDMTNENKSTQIKNDFIHFYPFGYDGRINIGKRIYVNTTPRNALNIAYAVLEKCTQCDKKELKPYFKFYTGSSRNDQLLFYCANANLDDYVSMLMEVHNEHPEWFNSNCSLKTTATVFSKKTGKDVFGIADEPRDHSSFNDKLSNAIAEYVETLPEMRGYSIEQIRKNLNYADLAKYLKKHHLDPEYPFLTTESVEEYKMKRQHEQGRNI